MKQALIVVDIQNDFVEGGSLAVPGGMRVAVRTAQFFKNVGFAYDVVVYTADWHQAPPSTNGGHFGDPPDFVDTWPVHCVEYTHGAKFHPAIDALPKSEEQVFRKGMGRPDYSGFQGVNSDGDTLEDYLRGHNVWHVDICGLAGDYCVRQTALDAVKNGFDTIVLPGLTASVGGHEATKETVQLIDDISCVE